MREVWFTRLARDAIAGLGDDDVIDRAFELADRYANYGRPKPTRWSTDGSIDGAPIVRLGDETVVLFGLLTGERLVVHHAIRLDE